SYKRLLREDLFQLLTGFDAELAMTLDYQHVPLTEQFETQGIRQIELDIFHDPEGGLYANRNALVLVGEDVASGIPELSEPGLKVMHVQEVDYETTCYTFKACLSEIKAWSDANPDHLPLTVLVEAKDAAITDPGLGFVIPLPFDGPALDGIDEEIRSIFPEDRLITPDFVRGDAQTLESVILNQGWPLLDDVRGRIMFALDNGGDTRERYVEGHPSLAGRVMFTDSPPGSPEAAFAKQNNPSDVAALQALVSQGYMVRTRADADTEQARTGDTTQREAALESGAHFVSTDYPVPDPRFTDYQVQIPGGYIARCNPVNATTECNAEEL
ncbi:MAG: phosphatidylinositol-specific phospholipase C1-like protein, partial [Halioglobus sp.]